MAATKKSTTPPENHIVRRWESCPIIYGLDSRDRRENPDYHASIALTSDGRFVADNGTEIDPKMIPPHILEAAKTTDLNIIYREPTRRTLGMDQAMLAAGVPDTEPDATIRAKRGNVGRRAFA